MDFVEWCSQFLKTLIKLYDAEATAYQHGIHIDAICKELFGESSFDMSREDSRPSAVMEAVNVLTSQGLVTRKRETWLLVDRSAREMIDDPISSWETICSTKLGEQEREVLQAVNKLSEKRGKDHAWREFPSIEEIMSELGWSDKQKYRTIAQELSKQ